MTEYAAETAEDQAHTSTAGEAHTRARLRSIKADEVEPQDVDWRWRPYIPVGKVTLLEGNMDVGKSWLFLDLIARYSRGGQWPDGTEIGGLGRSLICSYEDGTEDTIVPRLISLGADRSKIEIVNTAFDLTKNDLGGLREVVYDGDFGLVVLDPVLGYVGASVNTDKQHLVRKMLMGPLAKLADDTDCAMVAVRHWRKPTQSAGGALHRGMGSVDFMAASRSGLCIGLDPKDSSRRVLAHVKGNLAAKGPSLAFEIVDGRVEWDDRPCDVTADDLEDPGAGATKLDLAKDFLYELLADGPVCVDDIKAEVAARGCSWRTVRRAQGALGVKPEQLHSRGKIAKWVWRLP